jgi:formylglycine-generating enzyme required for sulfatase activity
MVYVPPAEFDSGTVDPTGVFPGNVVDVQRVRLRGFCIDRLPVTAGEYADCQRGAGCTPPVTPPNIITGTCAIGVAGLERRPATCVNWYQAQRFCFTRGRRLPTEFEWELAARGTDGRVYPWGNEPDFTGRACQRSPGVADSCAVGSFPAGASPFGLLDMVGNAYEMTVGWNNPTRPATGVAIDPVDRGENGFSRVSRGPGNRVDARWWGPPAESSQATGFRCAMTLPSTCEGSDDPGCARCNAPCEAGESCQYADGYYACRPSCQEGSVRCGPSCVDPRRSSVHCGACGRACAAGETCHEGACVAPGAARPCPAGQTACDGACVVVGRDREHCRGCNLGCAAGELCAAGACQPARCAAGTVLIPAATFVMGSDQITAVPTSSPSRRVRLDAYCIGRTEVLAGDYVRCITAGACPVLRLSSGVPANANNTLPGREAYPQNMVRWEEAAAYCRWAGGRLPTEAEWEYAAKGDRGGPFPWGSDPDQGDACLAPRGSTTGGAACPAGSSLRDVSPFGVQDMAGNMTEWTNDLRGSLWPYSGSVVVNPGGNPRGYGHVIRGSGFEFSAFAEFRALADVTVRMTDLNGEVYDVRRGDRGFRCVLPPTP